MKVNNASKKIAIVILNLVQYYTLKPFIDLYKKADIHIYVPHYINNSDGFDRMFDDTYNFLKEHYTSVYREVQDCMYDICLEPYPCSVGKVERIDCKIRIKYKYSAISAKASPSYSPDFNSGYDVILCYSRYEQEVLSAYAKTLIVGKLNYYNFNKEDHEKQTILYLPTYGNSSSLNKALSSFDKLRPKYKIIAKMHHGTTYLTSEKEHFINMTNSAFDEIYDEKTPLEQLLRKADLVISDNSGAIFEAIYAGIPVCIMDNSKNKQNTLFGAIDSYQNVLKADGIIPYCNTFDKIDELVVSALKKENIDKQLTFRDKEFPIAEEGVLSSFFNVIDYYLSGLPFEENVLFTLKHSLVILEDKKFNNLLLTEKELRKTIDSLSMNVEALNKDNSRLKNRLLYKLCNKVYNIYDKLKGPHEEK